MQMQTQITGKIRRFPRAKLGILAKRAHRSTAPQVLKMILELAARVTELEQLLQEKVEHDIRALAAAGYVSGDED